MTYLPTTSETGSAEIPSFDIGPVAERPVSSREVFEHYFDLRQQAGLVQKPAGDELQHIQDRVAEWVEGQGFFAERPDYSVYDKDIVVKKLAGLTDFLRTNFADKISEVELAATDAFVESSFALYEDRSGTGEVSADADGSFAFVVPARVSRKNSEYGEEVEPVIPALRYVPNALRADMMVNLPPFIIDVYERDEQGKRGYLVFAPVSGDMVDDLDTAPLLKTARKNINDTVDFAQERLGVNIVGLGATLPAMTRFGKSVTNPNVLVTTGHGGTARLITETLERVYERGIIQDSEKRRIGIIGLGSIGASIAELVAAENPDAIVNIYDSEEAKIQRTAATLAGNGFEAVQMGDEASLIAESDVIISAITSRLNLDKLGVKTMENKMVIDDSQPGSFDPLQVTNLGGNMTWVIGEDTKGVVVRNDYDYGTLYDPKSDLFGCEAEAGVLSAYSRDLDERGMPPAARQRILEKVAVRAAVTPDKARLIGALFIKYGIQPAKFQVFGKLSLPE